MHVIKLLDSAGTAVIDSVSSDYEDPLCLDPFEDLCQVFHQSNQKSFIIARVETRDHKQPDRSYYSYYNAFLLNKILFQTQVFHNKKLLHRLHVLNPLTNTDIIGDVQYFKVKLHSSSAADISPFATDSSSFKPTAPPISVSTNETSFDRLKLEEYSMNQSINLAKSPSVRQVEMMALTNQHADWTMTESRVNDFTETDPDVHSTSATNISENTSSAIPLENEHQESSDVVTPLNMSINRRQTMRRLSLRVKVEKQSSDKEHDTASQVFRVPMSPYTAPSGLVQALISSPAVSPSSTSGNITDLLHRGYHTSVTDKFPQLDPPAIHLEGSSSSYNNQQQQYIDEENEISVVCRMGTGISFQKKERVLPPATITRFSRPVAQEELNSIVPERQVERRRSLSLANATKSNGSRADYEEWVALAQAESLARTPTSSILGRTPTIKQPNDAQSLSSVNIVQASPNNLATVKNLHQQLPPFDSSNSVSTSEDNSFVWEAVLFGTDTDFLERAHVRMIFKNNALLPEDVVFFQLPEVPLPPTDAEIAEAAPHAASADNAATENNRDASGRREECVLL